MPNPTIEVFSTPSCVYCKLAKEYFKSKSLNYTEYNVAVDIPRQQEMIKATGQLGVPVIRINGQVILGFDRPKINKALGLN